MISHTRPGFDLLRALGSASCDILHKTRGTICYRHCALHLVISLTDTRDRAYDLLRALGSASGVITLETAGTICYRHCVLFFVISQTKQGVRQVTGIVFCILRYHKRDRKNDLLRALALGSTSCDIIHETGATICCGH